MKRKLAALVLATAAVSSLSCSGKLTRPEAQAQLEEQLRIASIYDPKVTINTGLVSGYCALDPSIAKDYDPIARRQSYALLKQLGAVTIEATDFKHAYQITLTDVGKKWVDGSPYSHTQKQHCDEWQVDLPVANVIGVQVTGIQQEGVHAKVDASLCRKLTPLGETLKAQNLTDNQQVLLGLGTGFLDSYHFVRPNEYCEFDSVMFNKYRDGWRAEMRSAI
jgi:hypothetical protein